MFGVIVYFSLHNFYKNRRALNTPVHKLRHSVRVRHFDEPDKLRPWVCVMKELGYREEGQTNRDCLIFWRELKVEWIEDRALDDS
jgi:hypothetical protein